MILLVLFFFVSCDVLRVPVICLSRCLFVFRASYHSFKSPRPSRAFSLIYGRLLNPQPPGQGGAGLSCLCFSSLVGSCRICLCAVRRLISSCSSCVLLFALLIAFRVFSCPGGVFSCPGLLVFCSSFVCDDVLM